MSPASLYSTVSYAVSAESVTRVALFSTLIPGCGVGVISASSSAVTGGASGSGLPGLFGSSGVPVVVAVFGMLPSASAVSATA